MSWAGQSGGGSDERWHISEVTGKPTAGFVVRWRDDGVTVLDFSRRNDSDMTYLETRASRLVGDVECRYDPELPGVVVKVGDREIGIADNEAWWAR